MILSDGFQYNSYGLTTRLVRAEDTDFILKLRTNEKLSKYINTTDNDRQKQLEWYRKYKLREAEGRDYYFIYYKDGKPIGVNRVYNIHNYYGTPGSWVCAPNSSPEDSLATYFCLRDIAFEILKLDLLIYDVRKANKKVCKFQKMLGAQMIGESDIDVYFAMNKSNYYLNRKKVLKLLNISVL